MRSKFKKLYGSNPIIKRCKSNFIYQTSDVSHINWLPPGGIYIPLSDNLTPEQEDFEKGYRRYPDQDSEWSDDEDDEDSQVPKDPVDEFEPIQVDEKEQSEDIDDTAPNISFLCMCRHIFV